MPGDRGQDVVGVEATGIVLDHDSAAGQPSADGVPVGGTVHEGRSRQVAKGGLGRPGDQDVEGLVDAEAGGQEVGLAPEHPLGHAGGPARVEDVEVVRGQIDRRAWLDGAEGGLIRDRARQEGRPGVVVDLEEQGHLGQVGKDGREGVGEGAMEDDGGGGAVSEDVAELVGHVPVVDVDGGAPGLGSAEHALEVLVAVVKVERHLVVGRLPRRPVRQPAMGAEAGLDEHLRQASGPVGDLRPGQSTIPPHDAVPIGDGRGDGLVEGGQVVLGGRHRSRQASATVTVTILSPTEIDWATSMPEVTLPKRL